MMDLKAKVLLLIMVTMMSYITLDLQRKNIQLNKEIDLLKENVQTINDYYLKKSVRSNFYSSVDLNYEQLSIKNFRQLNENLFNLNK